MSDPSPSSLPPLEAHLGFWLRRVSNPVSAAFARALQERQTTVAEWVALRYLAAQQESTPGALADALGMTRGATSKVLDRLERKAWATRRPHPEDGRVQLLSLTPEGARVLPELARIANRNDRRFFGNLTTEEQATLRQLLEKVAREHGLTDVPID